uniref:DUF4283 domain-containing protein n=1 Tax=Ananas comosus var. bracteatus TaxID=296719 RepID=A0A6V7Q6Y1_ANACO|nr:unnamed protein product [Ananas comosus var. bracteatus]
MASQDPSHCMKIQDLINDFRGLLATPSPLAIKLDSDDLVHDEFFNFCLVAKLHADIIPSIKGLVGVLRRAWTFIAPFKVHEAKHGIFLLSFKSNDDLLAVWDASPWSYNGTLIVLERFRSCTLVESYLFNSAPLWVQFHELPPDMLTPNIASKLASKVGEPAYLVGFGHADRPPNGQGYPGTADRVSPVHSRRRNQYNVQSSNKEHISNKDCIRKPTQGTAISGLGGRALSTELRPLLAPPRRSRGNLYPQKQHGGENYINIVPSGYGHPREELDPQVQGGTATC